MVEVSSISILQSGLLRQTAQEEPSMNSLIIGIAGGSGSGKTTLALRRKPALGGEKAPLSPNDGNKSRPNERPTENASC